MTDDFIEQLRAGLRADAARYDHFPRSAAALRAAARSRRLRQQWTMTTAVVIAAVALLIIGSQLLTERGLDAFPAASPSVEPMANPSDPSAGAEGLLGSWIVTGWSKAQQPAASPPIMLYLRSGAPYALSLNTGCSELRAGRFNVIDGGRLQLGEINDQSVSRCTGERRTQDDWLHAILRNDPHVTRVGDQLTMTTGDQTFTAERLTGASSPLAGTWRIVQAAGTPQPLLPGGTARLAFNPGGPGSAAEQVSVDSGGCVSWTAEGYAIRNGHLVLGNAGPVPQIACRPQLQIEAQWMAELVKNNPTATLNNDQLTLTGGGVTISAQRTSTKPTTTP